MVLDWPCAFLSGMERLSLPGVLGGCFDSLVLLEESAGALAGVSFSLLRWVAWTALAVTLGLGLVRGVGGNKVLLAVLGLWVLECPASLWMMLKDW